MRTCPGCELEDPNFYFDGCDYWCEECHKEQECDHSDTDEYSCLDCGKELLEDRMAAAYDRAKSDRQDGDT